MKTLSLLWVVPLTGSLLTLSGCFDDPPPQYPPAYAQAPPQQPEPILDPGPDPTDAYDGTELPVGEPEPIAAEYAPPPMIDETEPPAPYDGALWIDGFWGWDDGWAWRRGRWGAPPFAGYGWCNPYYENRGGLVVFVSGHWAAPGAVFVPPPMGYRFTPAPYRARPGVYVGPPASQISRGVFVPAPHGRPATAVVAAPSRPRMIPAPVNARVIPPRGGSTAFGGNRPVQNPPQVNRGGYMPAGQNRPVYGNGAPVYKPMQPLPPPRPMRGNFNQPVSRGYTPPRIAPQRTMAPAPSYHAAPAPAPHFSAPSGGGGRHR